MTAKGIRGRADILFSKIVRSEGVCQRCGENGNGPGGRLECSHFVSRRYSWTRTFEDNAVCLCSRCHREVGLNPGLHTEFFRGLRGEAVYREVRERAQRLDKYDWPTELERLKARAKELGVA